MDENIYENGGYLKHNPTWHAEDSLWKARQIYKILKNNNINPKTISEIGCGSGEILNQLDNIIDNRISYFGYDISPQAFEFTKKIKKDNVYFYLKNFINENDYCDVVLCIDVVEHIEDYIGFLRKLKTKGEYKIFHVPLDLSVNTIMRVSSIYNVRNDLGHLHYFNKEILINALQDTGYEIIDQFYTSGSTDLPAKSYKSALAKYPRKILFKLNEDFAVRLFGRYSLLVLSR